MSGGYATPNSVTNPRKCNGYSITWGHFQYENMFFFLFFFFRIKPALPASVVVMAQNGEEKQTKVTKAIVHHIHSIKCIHICIKRCKNSDKISVNMKVVQRGKKKGGKRKQDEIHEQERKYMGNGNKLFK